MKKLNLGLAAVACLSLIAWESAAQTQDGAAVLTADLARSMDANRDGVITKAEFEAEVQEDALFAQLDQDGDGLLDAPEIRAGVRIPYRSIR